MIASGTLTCPQCGRETPWPNRCEDHKEEIAVPVMTERDKELAEAPNQQHWAEAVIELVSDSAERERLIRLYDFDELVQACLALGSLALTAKTEYQRAEHLERALTKQREEFELLAALAATQTAGMSVEALRVLEAAKVLMPLLDEGWDEYDTPDDQNIGARACDELVAATKALLAAGKEGS